MPTSKAQVLTVTEVDTIQPTLVDLVATGNRVKPVVQVVAVPIRARAVPADNLNLVVQVNFI